MRLQGGRGRGPIQGGRGLRAPHMNLNGPQNGPVTHAAPPPPPPQQPPAPAQQNATSAVVPGQEGGNLTTAMLAAAAPEQQKQMLGERLFPQVQRLQPELAGKITGELPLLPLDYCIANLNWHRTLTLVTAGQQTVVSGKVCWSGRTKASITLSAETCAGMLLEMDNSELLLLLESPEALGGKVDEAINVLKQHNALPEGVMLDA